MLEGCKNPEDNNIVIQLMPTGMIVDMQTPSGEIAESVLDVKWPDDMDGLLERIENAIYDTPAIMDDFNTFILLHTDKILFFPSGTEEDEAYAAMKSVFNADVEDVWLLAVGSQILAFTFCRGLKSFLDRTFAGVRVVPSIFPLKEAFSTGGRLEARVYADLSAGCLTLLAYKGSAFVHGSVRRCESAEDAAYFIFLLWQFLDLKQDDAELYVSGPKEWRDKCMTIVRKHLNYVMLNPLGCFNRDGKITHPAILVFKDYFNNDRV